MLATGQEEGGAPNTHVSVVTFNANGDLVSDVPIPEPTHVDVDGRTISGQLSENIFINVLKNGKLCLAGNFVEDRPWIMVVERDGRVILSKPIMEARHRVRVTSMVRTGRDEFVLLGNESLNSFAVKFNATGQVIWTVTHDRGAADFFVDGVATRDGGTLLIEQSGQIELIGHGPSSLIIGSYDSKGQLEVERRIPGREGRVAAMSDGTFVLVYDRSEDVRQDLWVTGMDHGLKEMWSKSFLKIEPMIVRSGFRPTALADGGMIVLGVRHRGTYLAQLDSRGSLGWDFSLGEAHPVSPFVAAVDSNSALVVFAVWDLQDGATKVRISRVGMNVGSTP